MKRTLFMLAIAAVAPLRVHAQGCDLLHSANTIMSDAGLPTQTAIITEGALSCPGGKYIAAGEIGAIRATGTYTLNRNVEYRDADKRVTADFAQYFTNTALLQARGNVVVTDLKTGSRLTAPSLDYYQESKTNKVARMVTMGGRARAVLRRSADSISGIAAKRDSTAVDADVIELVGQQTFRGTGTAVITRSDIHGYGNFVEYDQDKGDLLLATGARIEAEKYHLQGDTIRALAAQGQQLTDVRAIRNGLLTSSDVRVESPFIHVYLDSGVVNRLVATRPGATRGSAPVSLPRVLSSNFNVSADSIDALAPGQQLERVDAVGHAFGERIDTMAPPPAAEEMPDVLSHDWLRGDVLHAVFVQNPDVKRAPGDTSSRNDRVLKQIVANGRSASSAIRRRDPKDNAWKIYYTLADTITVDFAKGEVSNVALRGDVHGVFLTPEAAAAPAKKPKGGQ